MRDRHDCYPTAYRVLTIIKDQSGLKERSIPGGWSYSVLLTVHTCRMRLPACLPGHMFYTLRILRRYVRRCMSRQESFVPSVDCLSASPIIDPLHVRIAFIKLSSHSSPRPNHTYKIEMCFCTSLCLSVFVLVLGERQDGFAQFLLEVVGEVQVSVH